MTRQSGAAEPSVPASGRHHHLACTPSTVHWGFFDGNLGPALTIAPGDRVTIDCVSGNPELLPPPGQGHEILPEHLAIHAHVPKGSGNHILTGPIFIRGAEPGGVLEVRILDIRLRQNWGWNWFRPNAGTLPEEYPYAHLMHLPIDQEQHTATMPWGLVVPLRPFFGQMAVAPKPQAGRLNSKEPHEWGGNIDCKELTAGSVLYLPVQVAGGLFSVGDGHAVQGDGEADGTALETALSGNFEFIVRPELSYTLPRAETPTHYLTFGLDADLDQAAKQALREMIGWLQVLLGISRDEAYAFSSFCVDLHVTQTVNIIKGVHAMVSKSLVAKG
jgi:acetamidase/formamidase